MIGVQAKYVGARWANDVNTEKAPAYTLVDLDVRYNLPAISGVKTSLQVNIKNLTDERYLGDISTVQTGAASYQPGYPRAVVVSLKASF
jgi:iron complex outermembrane receptor protein